jgi:hypothetical protein
MSRFKDFGGSDNANAEPISFKLWGQDFHCLPEIQGKVLLDMVADSSSEDVSKSSKIATQFFDTVLTDESRVRFDALIVDKEKIVTVETLGEIVGWLVEQYSNRPTERS